MSLKEKLAVMKAKHSGTARQELNAQAQAKAAPTNTETSKELPKPSDNIDKPFASLDSLVVAVKGQQSKLDKHLEQQEAKGVYNLDPAINEVEGLDAERFLTTMQNLDAATVEKTPDIRGFCREIRKNLEQYPELTHILTDDQLGIIVGGYLEVAGVETAPKTKAAKAKAKKKELTSLNDLGAMDLNDLFSKK